MPRNSSIGVIMLIGGMLLGMGLVWYMWWLAVLSLLAIVGAFIARTFLLDTKKVIPAEEVAREHQSWLKRVADTPPVTRDKESSQANGGVAVLEVQGVTP